MRVLGCLTCALALGACGQSGSSHDGAPADSASDARFDADEPDGGSEAGFDANGSDTGLDANPSDDAGQPSIESTASGFDWSLPGDTAPEPYSGFFVMGAPSHHELVAYQGVTLSWATLNPSEGVYDWSEFESELDDGVKRVFRLKCNSWEGSTHNIPDWVVDKYDLDPADMTGGDVKVFPLWDEGVQSEYLAFVNAFGEQGFAHDANLLGLYVHGISAYRGEELAINHADIAELERIGMSDDTLLSGFGDRLHAWAEAFGADAYKLAWVGTAGGNFRDTLLELDDLAKSLGMGIRGGNIESYYDQLGPNYAQSVDSDGYLITDDDNPIISEQRYFGDEIETYDPSVSSSPDSEFREYMYRTAILRALQMRMNFLWATNTLPDVNEDISRFFVLEAGKLPANAPDAWIWLRESYPRVNSYEPVKNFERWIHQREIEGSQTRPAAFTAIDPRYEDNYPPSGDAGDYTARATDVEHGQSRITFYVDQRFAGVDPVDVTFKLAYTNESGPFLFRYCTDEGVLSLNVEPTGSDSVETVTIAAPRFSANRCLDDQFDFDVAATGSEDAVISFVRVLRESP